MKNVILMLSFIILALSFGCRGKENLKIKPQAAITQATNTKTITQVSARPITPTPISYSPSPTASTSLTPSIIPTASETATRTATPTLTRTKTPTGTSTFPPSARLNLQCMDVLPTLSHAVLSGGVVLLGGGVGDKQRVYTTTLIDMTTGQATQIVTQGDNQAEHSVSPDGKYIAYANYTFSSDKTELVIASANGHHLITIPEEKKWGSILGWTNDRRLLLNYDEPVLDANGKQKTLSSYLVLNPFNGDRRILRPNFPNIDDSLNYLPYWDGWSGVVYDPTLTRAIYLRFIGIGEDLFTFAIWDVEKQRLVSTLEEIYTEGPGFGRAAPMPVWDPDGSYFIVMGQKLASEEQAEFELYRVSRDGQVEQLTHLTPVAILKGYTFAMSLSPDGHKIAMYLAPSYDVKESRVAVLDMETLDVTDYCIPVRENIAQAPIWSPDSTQFLVADQVDQENRRVILVDIVHNLAATIAENTDLLGWMVNP